MRCPSAGTRLSPGHFHPIRKFRNLQRNASRVWSWHDRKSGRGADEQLPRRPPDPAAVPLPPPKGPVCSGGFARSRPFPRASWRAPSLERSPHCRSEPIPHPRPTGTPSAATTRRDSAPLRRYALNTRFSDAASIPSGSGKAGPCADRKVRLRHGRTASSAVWPAGWSMRSTARCGNSSGVSKWRPATATPPTASGTPGR